MRNNALDAAKLVACFFIIVVHVGNYPELPSSFGELFRVSSRWALPFFFLASGYLMGLPARDDLGKKLNKLVSILFYTSLLYIPILYRMVGGDLERVLGKVISNDTLHGGTFFHLWFINALILGVILTNYALKNMKVHAALAIAVTIIIGCWFGDLIKSLGYKIYIFYALRTLIAFSLVYIGYFCARKSSLEGISTKLSLSVLLIGIGLMILEVYLMNKLFGADMVERQFPLLCVPVCIALLSLCINAKLKDNFISKLGMSYSLGVYLIHPFVLYIMLHDVGGIFESNSLVKLFTSFVVSIIILSFMKRVVPFAYEKLNGINVR